MPINRPKMPALNATTSDNATDMRPSPRCVTLVFGDVARFVDGKSSRPHGYSIANCENPCSGL
jgi:hypothetical protein